MNQITPILAIDLGTTTGFALGSVRPFGPRTVFSGTMNFKPSRFEGAGMKFLRFKRWLSEIKGNGDLGEIYFEEVRRHAGVDAGHCYGGFLGVLSSWCEAHEIPYAGVPVGTIKKFVTGKGNASKPEMVAAISARGFAPADHNEADALGLLLEREASTLTQPE